MAKTLFYFQEVSYEAMLFVFDEKSKMSKYPIEGVCVIGRKSSQYSPTIALTSSIVSRNHGEITYVNDRYYYYDHNSTNGTYINGELIGKNSLTKKLATEIKDGDVLSFDVISNGNHHPERVVAIFTTSLSKQVKWKKISLNNTIAEIGIGRSSENGINFSENVKFLRLWTIKAVNICEIVVYLWRENVLWTLSIYVPFNDDYRYI